MSEIKYKYAYTEDGKRVDIDDVTPEDVSKVKYLCFGCGRELRPRALNSKSKVRHFYHLQECNCPNESYLHALAKSVLKSRFEESKVFIIKLKELRICSKSRLCHINGRDNCMASYDFEFDLKKEYTYCKEEGRTVDGKFRADLLLIDEEKRNPQLLFEVAYKHPSTQAKKESGYYVVEFTINNEADALSLKDCEIKVQQSNESVSINLFGFRPFRRYILLGLKSPFSKIALLADGQIVSDYFVSCNEVGETKENEVCTYFKDCASGDFDDFERALSINSLSNLKKCAWCKYFEDERCPANYLGVKNWDMELSSFCKSYTIDDKIATPTYFYINSHLVDLFRKKLEIESSTEDSLMKPYASEMSASDNEIKLANLIALDTYELIKKGDYYNNWKWAEFRYGFSPIENITSTKCFFFKVDSIYHLEDICISRKNADSYDIFIKESISNSFVFCASAQRGYLDWKIDRILKEYLNEDE